MIEKELAEIKHHGFICAIKYAYRHKMIGMILTIIMFTLCVTYITLQPKKYTTEALLQKKTNHFLATIAKDSVITNSAFFTGVENEIEIIKSYAAFKRIVESLNLNVKVTDGGFFPRRYYTKEVGIDKFTTSPSLYNKNFQLTESNGLIFLKFNKKMYPLSLERENTFKLPNSGLVVVNVRKTSPTPKTYFLKRTKIDSTISYLRSMLKVDKVGLYSGLIKVQVSSFSPRLSVDIIRSFLQCALQTSSKIRQDEVKQMVNFMKRKTINLKASIHQQINVLLKKMQKNEMVSHSKQLEYYMSRLKGMQDEILKLNVNLQSTQDIVTKTHPKYKELSNKYTLLKNREEQLINNIKNIPEYKNKLSDAMHFVNLEKKLYYSLRKQLLQLQYIQRTNLSDLTVVVKPHVPDIPDKGFFWLKILIALFICLMVSFIMLCGLYYIRRLGRVLRDK